MYVLHVCMSVYVLHVSVCAICVHVSMSMYVYMYVSVSMCVSYVSMCALHVSMCVHVYVQVCCMCACMCPCVCVSCVHMYVYMCPCVLHVSMCVKCVHLCVASQLTLVGIITLEDVIEEMIGEEIVDETDQYVDVHRRITVARSQLARMKHSASEPSPRARRVSKTPGIIRTMSSQPLLNLSSNPSDSTVDTSRQVSSQSSVARINPEVKVREGCVSIQRMECSSRWVGGWIGVPGLHSHHTLVFGNVFNSSVGMPICCPSSILCLFC